MSAQFNYYYQNISFPRASPLIQNTFNSIKTNSGSNTYNNLNNSINNINENYNISKKNNGLINSNNKNSNQYFYIDNKFKYINEAAFFNSVIVSKEQTIIMLSQLYKNVCKICKSNNNSATGFFCKIPVFNSILPVLITNSHILNKDDIKVNRIIKIVLIEKEKEIEIENKKEIEKEKEKVIDIVINEPRITFTDENLDITIIEIIPEVDGINDFLEIDKEVDEINLKEKIKYLYSLQNINGKLCISYGELKYKPNGQKIIYSCTTSKGSSGSPILNLNENKVIGVHQGIINNQKIGVIIKSIVDEFNKTYNINKNKLNLPKREKEKGTEIKPLINNEFYVGDLENGKVAIYYSDGKLKYEGDRVDGNFEGKGTYYYKNGNKYEGEWKKGLKHGKGILYYDYEAKNKRYEGNYIKGEFEGKGIYYWPDGSYYIGDFVKGLKHGYGEYYKKDRKLKYKGDFFNDKYGGEGVYYCNNGDYYKGDFKDGLKHGKGTLYNKNGDVIIEGKFVSNKYQDLK